MLSLERGQGALPRALGDRAQSRGVFRAARAAAVRTAATSGPRALSAALRAATFARHGVAKQGFRRLGAWMCDCGDGWVPPTVPSPGPGGHGPGSTPGQVFRKKTNTVAEATFVVRGICRLLWLSVRKSEQHASSHAIRRYHANTQPARGRCA